MSNIITSIIPRREQPRFREFMSLLLKGKTVFMRQNDVLMAYFDFCDQNNLDRRHRNDSPFFNFVVHIQELFLLGEYLYIMHRPEMACFDFYRVNCNGNYMEKTYIEEYLQSKDRFSGHADAATPLKIDFLPFYDYSPKIRHFAQIGNGIQFLNRYLSSHLFQNPREWNEKLFNFLKIHSYQGTQLLVNGLIMKNLDNLLQRLRKTVSWLKKKSPDTPWKKMENQLHRSGFEPGWGSTAQQVMSAMQSLIDLLNAPDDSLLEDFISRVPMPLISGIAIISPHGWFGQNKVLGKPDTGGQVIYILDQVRALESRIQKKFSSFGLDIKPRIVVLTRLIPKAGETACNVKKEKIFQTENSWILRIPFQNEEMQVVPDWISRFKIWPYLENFALGAAYELAGEFSGRPDLIIGNYSDGNLVATLLADHFDVIHCTISHALEKTKYSDSALKWKHYEKDYHFSLQFIADLLSMNKSDFIITSTRQEIVGTETNLGQYESYRTFTMPGHVQVLSGIDLFSPKFNVIPPGVSFDLYFPYSANERRIACQRKRLENRLFFSQDEDVLGTLDEPAKPPVFTMARFDKVKNITGLIEAFAKSELLRNHCNLIFAAGTVVPEHSVDVEEKNEIIRARHLIKKYRLNGKFRWLPSIPKSDTGEVYRIMADKKGIFVQPALFEAFGLTIIEAMVSGLPTFATKFGGPNEIIEHGQNGYLLNTGSPELIATSLEKFIARVQKNPEEWERISLAGIERVHRHFNWDIYSDRLLKLAKIFGFWRFAVSGEGKLKMSRYCDFIYHFLFRGPAAELLDRDR